MLYRNMQQKMIDVLDQADRVHITGKGANKTDLYVNIWKLRNPEGGDRICELCGGREYSGGRGVYIAGA